MSSGKDRVEAFSEFLLTITGMRHREEYRATCTEGGAEILVYLGFRRKGEDPEPDARIACDADGFVGMLNGCGLMDWDGFDGAHPADVRDGTMFSMSATVNGGRRIRASGSENFPDGFRELANRLREMARKECDESRIRS